MFDDDEIKRLQDFKKARQLTSASSIYCACQVRSERRRSQVHNDCQPPHKFGDHPRGFRDKNTLEPILICSPYYQGPEQLLEIRKQAEEWADKQNLDVRFEDQSFYGPGTCLVEFHRRTPLSEGEKNRVLRRRKQGARVASE